MKVACIGRMRSFCFNLIGPFQTQSAAVLLCLVIVSSTLVSIRTQKIVFGCGASCPEHNCHVSVFFLSDVGVLENWSVIVELFLSTLADVYYYVTVDRCVC